jgi:hypothetical protein
VGGVAPAGSLDVFFGFSDICLMTPSLLFFAQTTKFLNPSRRAVNKRNAGAFALDF